MSDLTASEKILQLYNLLLLSSRAWSLTDLANRLDCSKPTILRMLDKIAKLEGQALKVESRIYNGRLQNWYSLERLLSPAARQRFGFTESDLQLLEFCRDLAAPWLPGAMGESVNNALARAAQMINSPGEYPPGLRYVHNAAIGRIDYEPFAHIIKTLLTAICKKRLCRIAYTALKKGMKNHIIAVTRLVNGRHALYAHGWLMKAAGRTPGHPVLLAVHRIHSADLLAGFHNLESPPENQGFGIRDEKPFRLKVHVAPDALQYMKERVFGPGQSLAILEDGAAILSFICRSEKEALSWVLGFGRSVSILEPERLARRARSEAYAILHNPLSKKKESP